MFNLELIGALFREIRLAKKLTLKDVSGDFLTESFVSKFERGQSEITLSRFFYLLNKLNVSIDEFSKIIQQHYPNEYVTLFEKASLFYLNNDVRGLSKLYNNENNLFAHSHKNLITTIQF